MVRSSRNTRRTVEHANDWRDMSQERRGGAVEALPVPSPTPSSPDAIRAQPRSRVDEQTRPAFRVPRLFPGSSRVTARLRAAADEVVRSAAERGRVRAWVPAWKDGG